MSFLAWIILGLIAGFVASNLASGKVEGLLPNSAIGIVGAIIGGCLFNFFGMLDVRVFNLYHLFVAVVGAVVLIITYHALSRTTL